MEWKQIKTIAIIGASPHSERASNEVMKYFIEKGFAVVPINPNYSEILGKRCYPSLLDVPPDVARAIDMVDIFRKSEFVLPIVKDAIQLKMKYGNLKVVWMQEGVINEEAAEMARNAGIEAVSNMCAMTNLKSLDGNLSFHL